MTSPAESRSGFTLAELLAAMMFLAILLPVIVQGLTLASRAGVAASRGAVALQLAENKLTELIADASWTAGGGEGDFGEDWPSYRWRLEQAPGPVDALAMLTVHVDYDVQGRTRQASLYTWVGEDAE